MHDLWAYARCCCMFCVAVVLCISVPTLTDLFVHVLHVAVCLDVAAHAQLCLLGLHGLNFQ